MIELQGRVHVLKRVTVGGKDGGRGGGLTKEKRWEGEGVWGRLRKGVKQRARR
jgi:hypothetical protein